MLGSRRSIDSRLKYSSLQISCIDERPQQLGGLVFRAEQGGIDILRILPVSGLEMTG